MKNLIKKAQTFSKRFGLLPKGSKIVAGVSGGPDSVCLLSVLNELKEKYNLEIMVAHFNYGLRGKDSDNDEKFTRELAKKLGLKIIVKRGRKFGADDSNLENKLRNARYKFFEEVRKNNKFDLIAVGHQRDDQAETLLMRILRGAGLQGLSGMRPKTGKIIRPLLEVNRKDILKYLDENDLDYRIDKTNRETDFFRNKIRLKLLPYLEKEYNPSIRNLLAKMAGNFADDYDFINRKAREAMKESCLLENDNVRIDVKKIKEMHPALQKQVLRQAILQIKDNLKNVESSHIEEILKIAKSDKGKKQRTEFKGLKVMRKGDIIQISV